MGEMEMEEIEAVLEKICDLHDKLSDEIHMISRSHFLKSVKPATRSEKRKRQGLNSADEKPQEGYVFIKGFPVNDNDAAIQEAKSLNAIRTALEHLEDQLEFFHIMSQTIHNQQRTERDVAVARLEQSRMLLAKRLAEHHGKSYGVLDETLAFVGSIKTSTNFVYNSSPNTAGAYSDGPKSNFVINAFAWTFGLAKRALGFNHVRGVLGNAAIFAISMVAMLHLQQVASSEHHRLGKKQRKTYRREMSSSEISLDHLDVMMARG
ncbi:plastid division protein PDV1 isoform X1 [Brassica rapa]|uniref:plastid division protein PDV1 isoform X1 n=1 Tax=Brassica campestris TaxID=3711 RepID=UPI0004F19E22|nr:plastid division protein PDV1 isoform X1 [Brassica rapa]